MKRYELLLNGQVVGSVILTVCGRYFVIKCRSDLKPAGRYRLHLKGDNKIVALSLCVPYEDGFGTECNVPVGSQKEEELSFYLEKESAFEYMPVCSNQPFKELINLRNARFIRVNDRAQLLLISGNN